VPYRLSKDQWGSKVSSTTEKTDVTFPITFGHGGSSATEGIRNVLIRTASLVFIPVSMDLAYTGFSVNTIKVGNSSATQYTAFYLAIGVENLS